MRPFSLSPLSFKCLSHTSRIATCLSTDVEDTKLTFLAVRIANAIAFRQRKRSKGHPEGQYD